jgi:hypothetical protein
MGDALLYLMGLSYNLRLGLLVTLVVLALCACEGGEKEAKPQPLPEDPQALLPGEYRSEEFEPSLSFTVGKGWTNEPLELPDHLAITGGLIGRLSFANVQEIYEPTKTGTPNVVEAPEDMVGWFEHHPYLQTDKRQSVTVGGIKGEQLDVVFEEVPEEYSGVCGIEPGPEDCVDLFRLSSGLPGGLITFYEGDKARMIVLEDVKGETVTIGIGSPAPTFDEFVPKAQKVLHSVKWSGQ